MQCAAQDSIAPAEVVSAAQDSIAPAEVVGAAQDSIAAAARLCVELGKAIDCIELLMSSLEFNSWRPKLAASVILLERENAFCFFRPEVPDWLVGNQNAAAILSRCNGSMTASDLARLVSGEHNGIKPEEVLEFLTTLHSENALLRRSNC